MSAQHILLIAPHGSYRTNAYLQAAQELNYQITLASQSQHSIVSSYQSGLHIDLTQTDRAIEQLTSAIGSTNIDGVVSTDDLSIELASRMAKKLNLAHNGSQAVKLTRRKDLARKCLKKAGLQVPLFQCIDLKKPIEWLIGDFPFPAVIKPVNLSGSLGVIRVNNKDQATKASKRIASILQDHPAIHEEEKQTLLLEQYIPGFEIAVEGMLTDGKFELITIFDKPKPLQGPYFEESYYITPSRLDHEAQVKVSALISKACKAYGLNQGPIHAECRINQSGIWIIEIAARTIGGMCAKLFQFGHGYRLEHMVLANAAQQSMPRLQAKQASGVLMIPIPKAGILKQINGLQSARKVKYITDLEILIRPGHELIPLPEGSSYLGFIFSRAPNTELVESSLSLAHQCLKFRIDPIWKINNSTHEKNQIALPTR